ncbi:MAG: hypothetical protein ACXWUG_18205, partial [Polyangiales bacterium]
MKLALLVAIVPLACSAVPPPVPVEPATVPPVEAPPAPVAKPKNIVIGHGTKVLVVGDSMVRSGLGLRIAELVRARGGVYLEDYSTKNEGDRLEKLVIAL